MAVYQPHRHRGQARSHNGGSVRPEAWGHHKTNVGAGLPAMAVCLPTLHCLNHCYRGQARSHRGGTFSTVAAWHRAYTGLRMRISSETPTLSNRAVLPLANASTPSCSVSPASCAAMFITSASREYTPPSRE